MTQPYAAFQAAQPNANEKRTAAMLGGEVVSDSESDNATEYLSLQSISDQRAQKIISKKKRALARRTRRQKAKMIAEKDFLCRKKRS